MKFHLESQKGRIAFCNVWDNDSDLNYDIECEEKNKKNGEITISVAKGKKIYVDFLGSKYGYSFKYSIKRVNIGRVKGLRTTNRNGSGYTYLRWNPVKNIKGYCVQISQTKNFRYSTKRKIVHSTNIKVKIKKNDYYARVCAYKKKYGIKVLGRWSAKKRIKK